MALPAPKPTDIVYSCTTLVGSGKEGVLVCDKDGYYEFLAGAIGYRNNSGLFYAEAPAREAMLSPTSSLQRKLLKGTLYGEDGHPRWEVGMTKDQWFARLLDIQERNSSHHIRKVRLVPGMRDKNGHIFTGVILEIRPCVEREVGREMKDNLENKFCNTYLSVRSFTNDIPTPTGWVKNMTNCITWDKVNEGGVLPACKYFTPSLEAFSEPSPFVTDNAPEIFTQDEAARAINRMVSGHGTGLESLSLDKDTLLRELGLAARRMDRDRTFLL